MALTGFTRRIIYLALAVVVVAVISLAAVYVTHITGSKESQIPEGQEVAQAATPPAIGAQAAILYDPQSGNVLFDKNAYTPASIASLTKIMTLLLASEQVTFGKIKLNQSVTVTPYAAGVIPIKIGYPAGASVTYEELLYASALYSANDAATALAEFLGGSEAAFASWMTRRAASLGLQNTSFVDSTGLKSISSGNYSTPYDVARLSAFALRNELFAKLVSTKERYLPSQKRTVSNFNKLLGTYQGAEGIKTGTSTAAGLCLAGAATRDNYRLITVILGTADDDQRYGNAKALLDYGFNNLTTVVEGGRVVAETPVKERRLKLDLLASRTAKVFTPRGEKVATKVEIPETPSIPVEKGQTIGKLVIYKSGTEVDSVPLVARRSVGQTNIIIAFVEWLLDLLGLY